MFSGQRFECSLGAVNEIYFNVFAAGIAKYFLARTDNLLYSEPTSQHLLGAKPHKFSGRALLRGRLLKWTVRKN